MLVERTNSMSKKKILINRDKCIGCGACVACSNCRIKFIDSKAWSSNADYDEDEAQDICDVCPVDAISTGNEEEYEKLKEEYKIKDDN